LQTLLQKIIRRRLLGGSTAFILRRGFKNFEVPAETDGKSLMLLKG
jgi:hypothetical protein